MSDHPHENEEILFEGVDINSAKSVMILIHGRGATAESILTLIKEFTVSNYIYAAPQANGNTWYPYSFLSPIETNEPGLSSGLKVIDKLINKLNDAGISNNEIILLGFSQGACPTLEYAARNAKYYKGVIGLSGGLIGDKIDKRRYSGSFENCPVFLGCSNIDPHVPEERVKQTAEVMEGLGASVTKRIYKNMGHTINEDEINFIRNLL
ncbi:MAG: dienelactone hydrolase family protein [Ignavibacteria bacterium]|nr:dienelactone hydrolase family protein [Ignavibacteria bacterium]